MQTRIRSFLPVAIGTISIVSLAACSGSSEQSADEPTTVQLGHTLTENSSWQVGAEHFAEIIQEETDGRYEVEIFPNGQLASGNQRSALEMLRQGNYDVDMTSTLIWSGFDERLGITAMPWILPNQQAVDEVVQGDGAELLLDILSDNGVTPVGIGETGYRQMFNNTRPIQTPSDIEDLTMRVPGTPLFLDLYNALGSDPVEMDFTEVFSGLQQGTIDGMEGVADVVRTNQFYEALDYMSLTNYNFDFFFTTFSNDFYDGLSDEDQDIFMEAGQEATDHASEYAREQNDEAVEMLEEELEVYELSDDEIADFQEVVSPIYDTYRDRYSPELREAFNYPE